MRRDKGDRSRAAVAARRAAPGSAADEPHGRSLLARLERPVDIAPLVFLRIVFGAVMTWEVGRYFAHGWIETYFIGPAFHFKYLGFDWVRAWPGAWMYVHFTVLGLLAIAITLGYRYRAASALFALGFAYVFLLDEARYLNHFYLIALIAFLLAVLPADRAFSLDVAHRRLERRDTIPAWQLWLVRLQIGIPYFYGGIAKLNADWLAGEPMRMWLSERTHSPVVGSLFTNEAVVQAFVHGGLWLDLLAVPLLVWKRTRVAIVVALALFHLANAALFSIGVFPWLMLAASAVYFEPASVRRAMRRIGFGAPLARPRAVEGRPRRIGLALAGVYLLVQLGVPLRHFLYPGDVSWTEEGHRFAWHMKLRDKEGIVHLRVAAGDQSWQVDPAAYLAKHQVRKLVNGSDMILQLAHHVARDVERRGHGDVRVHALAYVSLNGREPQVWIDPAVDLAREERRLGSASWIVPLATPLRLARRSGGRSEESD